MLEYFLSPAKADLLPTDRGSSARSHPLDYGPCLLQIAITVADKENSWTTTDGLEYSLDPDGLG